MEHKIDTIKSWLGTGSINIFGRPFAGKDTQCNRLMELFGAPPTISGGHILRTTDVPEHVKKLMDAGELVPIDDYLKIITPYLSKPEFTGKPLVLSSLGRWHGEEEGIMRAAHDSGHELKAVIYLDISEAVVRQRWEAMHAVGDRYVRADDSHASLEVRFKEFSTKTIPVLDFYRELGLLVEIDGNASPDQVTSDILAKLYERASQ